MKRGTLHRNLRISGRSPDRPTVRRQNLPCLPRVTTRTCRVLCIIGPVRSPIGGLFERSLPPSALSGAFKNDPRVRDERDRGMCGTTGERAAPIRWVSGTFTLAAEPAGVDVPRGISAWTVALVIGPWLDVLHAERSHDSTTAH